MGSDGQGGKPPSPTLLSLPFELRELIYEHYLGCLFPATFVVGKEPTAQHWTLNASRGNFQPPSLLLACNTLSSEFKDLMTSKLSLGPVEGIPLSKGPTIKIDPKWTAPSNDETDQAAVCNRSDASGDLQRVISTGPPSLRLHLVMPQSPTDAVLFATMLAFVVAVCNDTVAPLKHVHVVRDPVTGPGWAADIDAIGGQISRIRCDSMGWQNWYRQWYAASPADANSDDGGRSAQPDDLDIDDAWADVLETCRECG